MIDSWGWTDSQLWPCVYWYFTFCFIFEFWEGKSQIGHFFSCCGQNWNKHKTADSILDSRHLFSFYCYYMLCMLRAQFGEIWTLRYLVPISQEETKYSFISTVRNWIENVIYPVFSQLFYHIQIKSRIWSISLKGVAVQSQPVFIKLRKLTQQCLKSFCVLSKCLCCFSGHFMPFSLYWPLSCRCAMSYEHFLSAM